MNITGLWDQLVDCICRPPRYAQSLCDVAVSCNQLTYYAQSGRDRYTTADLPGGVAGTFKLKGKEYLRKDIRLVSGWPRMSLCGRSAHLCNRYYPAGELSETAY